MIPGEIIPASAPIVIDSGLTVTRITATNTSGVSVHLTAHFHVFEANPLLRFDRRAAFGMRLKTHAKGAVRFEPGETKLLELVPIGGGRIVRGFNGAVDGPLDQIDPDEATAQLVERGFLHQPEGRG